MLCVIQSILRTDMTSSHSTSVKADQSKSAAMPTSCPVRPNEASESTTAERTPSETTPSQEELKSLGGSGVATKPVPSTGTGGDGLSSSSSGVSAGMNVGGSSGEPAPIRAPASLWRCSRIMHLLRDLRPTLLSALEGIVDQVSVYICHTARRLTTKLLLCVTNINMHTYNMYVYYVTPGYVSLSRYVSR